MKKWNINYVFRRIADLFHLSGKMKEQTSLDLYIHAYIRDAATMQRTTIHGKYYAASTIKTLRSFQRLWDDFQKERTSRADFKDIDMSFYHGFISFFQSKGHSVNTVGKTVKILKSILSAAESDGANRYTIWKDRRFTPPYVESDSIFLTKEEVRRLSEIDLSNLGKEYEKARDIFLVGIWTAQRVSDYSRISKESIRIIPRDGKENITYIDICQKKTGKAISVPCSSELKKLLDKYGFELPHINENTLNHHIKIICRIAGITQTESIRLSRNGHSRIEFHEKWELVHSHTARRTGATLMYLSGMDIYDIMKITGHSSPSTLKRYIKADKVAFIEKVMDKYSYFK